MFSGTVRPALRRDISGADTVETVAFGGSEPPPNPLEPAKSGFIPAARVVAIVDGTVVGTVRYGVIGDRIHLVRLGVDPKHRRAGVARALVAFVARQAESAGLRALSLYTVRATGNVKIFDRLGFQETLPHGDVAQPECVSEAFLEFEVRSDRRRT